MRQGLTCVPISMWNTKSHAWKTKMPSGSHTLKESWNNLSGTPVSLGTV